MKPLPADDLDAVIAQVREAFTSLRGARILVTGGTGFFGHWLVESLLHANRALGLDVRITLLTRHAPHFRASSPWVADDVSITLLQGDVRSFHFPVEKHTHILHAATDSGSRQDESALSAEIVAGTQHVLAFAKRTRADRLLYVSSGAVYGRGVHDVAQIAETYPLPSGGGAYDEAKRIAERLCLEAGGDTGIVIARCFAFVGPRLPLATHFAIGNFIADALAGRAIHIEGDGTPLRSYLYMSDLAAWLWTMLIRGAAGQTYNVGSDEAVSIAELARLTAETLHPGLAVQVDGVPSPGAKAATYVPSIAKARAELGLGVSIGLREAMAKTAAYVRS